MNVGQVTKDPVYADAERRFAAIETQTKKLHAESKRYWEAVNGMLDHQIEFSKAIEEIYKPISGRASDVNAVIPEGNPDGIAACQQYRDLVTELREVLKPELEMIQTRVLEPADELLAITKSIKKMLTKRDHKQLDYDRHAASLKKLQEKKERSVKEEEKLYKVENDFEIASHEYNYYNDLLKEELPKLFDLEVQFIRPLFQSFYFMQLNVFYSLFIRMEEMKIPYFDLNPDIDIVEQYHNKRGDIKERTEEIGITHFRTGHAKAKLEATQRRFAKHDAASTSGDSSNISSPAYSHATTASDHTADSSQPPGYSHAVGAHVSAGYPKEKQEYQTATATPSTEWCTALYDYTAQADGDLSFSTGDRIEILQRTADANGWWTGRLRGVEGVFPGNYVQVG